MADKEAREALREHLVRVLYKALSPNFEISFAEGYRVAADALLDAGAIRWSHQITPPGLMTFTLALTIEKAPDDVDD
jgi:hypothetical protein